MIIALCIYLYICMIAGLLISVRIHRPINVEDVFLAMTFPVTFPVMFIAHVWKDFRNG